MGLFDQDLTLPGVVTEIISDYSSGYDTSLFGTTEAVTVIGTAFNGPVGKPVPIYSPEHARYTFGAVYDSKTRRQSTLVAEIKDAWDRGCRTIYAVRISGKSIHKDFQLALDTNLKLRVSGIFPSNSNKDLSLLFDNSDYNMNIKIFKPADRATINEKKQGFVDKKDSVIVNTIDLYSGGLGKTEDLTELIKRVNDYSYNNVIRLSIVDEKGNDVTLSSTEAKGLKIGDMFPGLYLIGRDTNADGVIADTQVKLNLQQTAYNASTELVKDLVLNTNIINDLPIYAKKGKETLAANLGINMIEAFDFLQVPGKVDTIFLKDNIDYEEVDLSDFDIYKRLGSGFATTAHVVLDATKTKAKVKETTDPLNKKVEIKDGIYSMLENLDSKYRVLTGVNADVQIKGKLPKAQDFKIAVAKEVKMFNDSAIFKTVIDSKDFSVAKKYEISFAELSDTEEAAIDKIAKEGILNKTVREASVITKADLKANAIQYKEGSLFLCLDDTIDETSTDKIGRLYMYSKGRFQCLHSQEPGATLDSIAGTSVIADGKLYECSNKVTIPSTTITISTFVLATLTVNEDILVSLDNGTFQVATVSSTDSTVTLLGTAEQIYNAAEDKILTAFTSNYGTNKVVIKSNIFDFTTVDELVEYLNKNKDFSKLFDLTVLDITKAQDYVQDILTMASTPKSYTLEDKEVSFDTNLYIPFRTDDSFVRHLAQHCMYTSMKTAPTHGVIGCKSLLDINLDSIARRTKELVDLRLDSNLVAKKPNGTNILDQNNNPYPIGRKVSVTVGQYLVTTDDNYTYVSNMASGYAGMISALPLDQSSTCQTINIPEPMYELTNYQLSLLTSAGFVTAKKSYSKGWVITDGITMAPIDSEYKRLSASRIADGIEDVIRTVCEAYIGKQNNITNQNSLRSAIKSDLDKLKDKLIEAYDFKLILDRQSTKLGIINIDYSIIPIYEIKEINNRVTITDK